MCSDCFFVFFKELSLDSELNEISMKAVLVYLSFA